MKRLLPLILLTALALPLSASHIVGGEFELLHRPTSSDAFRYRLRLLYYFDVINNTFRDSQGRPVAPEIVEPTIRVAIFRKSDNALMRYVTLSFDTKSRVSYTQPQCSNGEIITDKLIYTEFLTLSAQEYSDPEGYYVSWERCCRNYTIVNIHSANPDFDVANAAGQTFYLQFPPVTKDGSPFVNNSPQLFPPLNDYACLGKPYYADFAGSDLDDDSLIYSLTTPLVTHSNESYPPLLPAPYPEAQWMEPTFGFNNIIGGNPDLKISSDGFLTVRPVTFAGLFVFAVKVEEFRNGIKIGEVRRDFQMLVVECREAVPPVITGKKLADPQFTYKDFMYVTFDTTATDDTRCIEVKVSDKDVFRQADNFREAIHLKAIPLGFRKDVSGILPSIKDVTLTNIDSIRTFKICFDECPYFEGGPFMVGIIAYDDACALPLHDTLKVLVNVQPPKNRNPRFLTPDVTETLPNETLKTWPIHGWDDDHDPLTITTTTDGFLLANYGMSIIQTKNANGDYQAALTWDLRCHVFDFSHRTSFQIKIKIEDGDQCAFTHPATMTFNLNFTPPPNQNPIIDTDLTPDPFEKIVTGITRKLNEPLHFNVTGTDGDLDSLTLILQGKGFNVNTLGVNFPGGKAKGMVQSPFDWSMVCDKIDLRVKDEFDFQFIVIDNRNKCRVYKADTVDVLVKLKPQDNRGPKIFVANLNSAMVLTADNTMNCTLGQKIELGLSGVDSILAQADHLHLSLLEATGDVPPQGYSFTPADGIGEVSSTFVWQPDCGIFATNNPNDFENNYTFTFLVTDDRCFNEKGDTITVNITIKDVDGTDINFLPPNFVSPNGDGKNDFFAMVKRDDATGDLINILPLDNCSGHFETVLIYNRWGQKIYGSSEREFRWFPDGDASGVYFYQIQYTNKEYKGSINVSYWEGQSQSQR